MKIFNTAFESELRALMLLSVFNNSPLSLDQITLLDFITIYGKAFRVSTYDLHGNNLYKFSELNARRSMFKNGLKRGVLDHFIQLRYSSVSGFLYKINDQGLMYVDTLSSTYKTEYIAILKNVKDKFGHKSPKELLAIYKDKALEQSMEE